MQGIPSNDLKDKNGNLTTATTTAVSSTYIPSQQPKSIATESSSLTFTSNVQTLSQGKSSYEQHWEGSASPMINDWIRVDPVIKSTAVGGVFVVGGAVAAEAAPSVISGGKAIVETAVTTFEAATVAVGTKEGVQAAVGAAVGVVDVMTEAPLDSPPIPLPSPTSEFTRQLINTSVALTKKFIEEENQ